MDSVSPFSKHPLSSNGDKKKIKIRINLQLFSEDSYMEKNDKQLYNFIWVEVQVLTVAELKSKWSC